MGRLLFREVTLIFKGKKKDDSVFQTVMHGSGGLAATRFDRPARFVTGSRAHSPVMLNKWTKFTKKQFFMQKKKKKATEFNGTSPPPSLSLLFF